MKSELEKKIAQLKATPRALIGCDEGTHSEPSTYRIYEEISGERYAVHSFAGSNGTRCEVEYAKNNTAGNIRMFPNSIAEMKALRVELRQLEKQLRQTEANA